MKVKSGAFLLILSGLLPFSDGKNLQASHGEEFGASAWLTYGSQMKRYPQCCSGEDDCQMLRLSERVITALALASPEVRVTFSGVNEKMDIILAFDETLGAATGKAVVNGQLYYVEPLTQKEMSSPPCFVKDQARHMHLFHKLRLMRKSGALTPALASPLQGTPAPSCCVDSASGVCSFVSVDTRKLSQGRGRVSIPLPWRSPELHMDSLEDFSLQNTIPKSCKGYCDEYRYAGYSGMSLEITISNSRPEFTLKRGNGNLQYSMKYCQAEQQYVVTAKRDVMIMGMGGPSLLNIGRTLELGCNYVDYMCKATIIKDVCGQEVLEEGTDYTETCRELCGDEADCKHFTWTTRRGKTNCYLLEECHEKRNAVCLSTGDCVSGPKECDVNTTMTVTGCDPPESLGAAYIPWQCNDDQGRVLLSSDMRDTLPVGSICHIKCKSWKTHWLKEGVLESTCGSDGEWTTTRPHNSVEDELVFPPGPYPSPLATNTSNPPALKCECAPFHMQHQANKSLPATYYDPRDEDGASFICHGPSEVDTSGGKFVVPGDNECILFCDSDVVALLQCRDGHWLGDTTTPFYCHDPPTKQGVWKTARSPKPIKVTLKNIDDREHLYDVPPSTEIDELKRQNVDNFQFPQDYIECQMFAWKGYEMLGNTRTLEDYGVLDGDDIWFMYKC